MEKLCIGIPAYGGQLPSWWRPLTIQSYHLKESGIELVDVFDATTMAVDHNRNGIVRHFLETDADWLMWIDSDNPLVQGAIRRLLDTRKRVVSGLYISKTGDPKAIAYLRTEDGRYAHMANWTPGELIPVDAVGLGCCLTHRSVYEQIDQEFVPLQKSNGGVIAVHEDEIKGDLFPDATSEKDGKVINGVYHERVFTPTDGTPVPFFALQYNRTEDIWFFELVRRIGIQPWLDTSIEVAHERTKKRTPQEYYKWKMSQGMF